MRRSDGAKTVSCPYTSPTRFRGVEGIINRWTSHYFARTSKKGSLARSQSLNAARKGCSFVVAMKRSSRSKRGIGLLVVLAFWSLGSTAIAHTRSGEAATEQMARAQAMRMAPKEATVSSVDCEEKDVGFSTRFRCTAHWTEGNQ